MEEPPRPSRGASRSSLIRVMGDREEVCLLFEGSILHEGREMRMRVKRALNGIRRKNSGRNCKTGSNRICN